MSRPVSGSGSVDAVPSGVDTSHSSNGGISSQSSGYADSSNTSYATITATTGASVSSYVSYTFDVDGIPSGATITSVTCSVKGRVSSTNYLPTAVHQLYAGGTAKGSTTSFASTTASARSVNGGSSWTLSEIANIQIRSTVTRGTSNTTRSANFRFYGASLTVSYTYSGTEYEITVSNSTSATVGYEQWVPEGEDTTVTTDTLTGITVKDNGVDVTSQFVQASGGTVSATPGSTFTTGFSSSSGNFYQSSSTTSTSWLEYAIGHSAESPYSTSNTSNTYVKPEGSTGWINYHFDFSEIPTSATINSVSVKVYGGREDSTVDSTHVARFQCYSGSTAKGTLQNFTSTSNGIVTVSDVGTWTASELHDAQLRFELGYYGGRMLGITWTVTYTASGYVYTISNVTADHALVFSSGGAQPELYVKVNGTWTKVQTAYKKVNGTWTQVDISQAFQSGVNYVQANP